jgi:hypothetical protein
MAARPVVGGDGSLTYILIDLGLANLILVLDVQNRVQGRLGRH